MSAIMLAIVMLNAVFETDTGVLNVSMLIIIMLSATVILRIVPALASQHR